MLKLAVFDLDGTLKQVRDPYVYLHEHLGVAEEGNAIIAAGMAGQLPYEEWLRLDAQLWRGTPRAVVEQLLRADPYVPGARETVIALQDAGVQVAIISTGLLLHAEMVAEELGIDPVFGNEIFFTGEGSEAVVSGEVRAHVSVYGKGDVMAQLQAELDVAPAECLAVGDSLGDLPLFELAAVSVAINPNCSEVLEFADIVLPEPDLRPLLARLHIHAPHLWPWP